MIWRNLKILEGECYCGVVVWWWDRVVGLRDGFVAVCVGDEAGDCGF